MKSFRISKKTTKYILLIIIYIFSIGTNGVRI